MSDALRLDRHIALRAQITEDALERIEEALDSDCDETGVALYNPRRTVLAVRMILSAAKDKLELVQKGAS